MIYCLHILCMGIKISFALLYTTLVSTYFARQFLFKNCAPIRTCVPIECSTIIPVSVQHGLCSTMQQLHWFSEAANVDTFVPRGYCIGQAEERTAFIQDYRVTACISLLVWITEMHSKGGNKAIADPMGEVGYSYFK